MITLKPIRENAGAPAYTRGNQVYKRGLVGDFEVENQGGLIIARAWVEGSYDNKYRVELVYDRVEDDFLEYSCECEAFANYQGMCKHCVGTALKLLEYEQGRIRSGNVAGQMTWRGEKKLRSTDREVLDWIHSQSVKEKSHFFQAEVNGKVELLPILHRQDYYGWKVEFKIGAGQNYVVKNITSLVEAVRQQVQVEYGKKLKFYHQLEVFSPHSQKVLKFLEACVEEEQQVMCQYRNQRGSSFYYFGGQEYVTERMMLLSGERMVRFAALYAGQTCALDSEKSKKRILFVEDDPDLKFKVEETEEGACRLSVPAAEVFFGVDRLCICTESTVYLCSREYSKNVREVARLLKGKKQTFWIHPEDLTAFCAALPSVEQWVKLKKPEFLSQYEPRPCAIKIYLDRQEGEITAVLYGEYGEEQYNLIQPASAGQAYRDIEKESVASGVIRRYFQTVEEGRGIFVFPETDEDRVYALVSEGIPTMQQMGEVYVSDALKALRVYRSPKVAVGISLSDGMLDITLHSEHFSPEELARILSGYKRKKRFYRLKDGSFLTMEDSALGVVAEMAEGLEMDAGDLALGRVQVPEYRAFYLDQLLREQNKDIQVNRNREYRALLREFKNVEDCDFEVPQNLQAQLRPYQKFGFRWMCTLDKLGFGGILADDMGLGKTVQTIAFLLAGKEKKDTQTDKEVRRYALIVCPASLVYNWESEIHRFAPDFVVTPVVGTASAREELIRDSEGEIFLTSYDLLKRDLEHYRELHFKYMVIDEAQNIKNHLTQAAKAVKAVSCDRRFALTGTPIENSLSELWSIFDYLMPGILNSYIKFRENYEQPIVGSQDERITSRLRRMIRPFILRRLKGEVLKELPDKLEEVVYSRMEEEQRQLYVANTQQLLDSLKGQSAKEFNTGKIQILAALTRLRQLCCDPGMIYENYGGKAVKVDTCMELIRNGTEAGNKILVFSQFTQALDILKGLLEKEKIACYLLTGATPKEKRAEMVRAFNTDQTPVFLISLKAGGTGLNLTAATIVIHFDPWWNMAAQNQATDRTHRIGQEKVVTVYKLIVKDTLEERILKLQEKKAQLSDDIISDGRLRDVLATKEEFMEILQGN